MTLPPSNETGEAPPLLALKSRRTYNRFVGREAVEDYALRYTPPSARRRPAWRVAQTAFGGASSFMALELLGASVMLSAGAANAFWAILATCLVAAAFSIPLSFCAARNGLDMDLITRGAGFGYMGSTITSLIYAFCTFFFFALEAIIMAYALERFLGVPLVAGYLASSCLVIPLAVRGMAALSALQKWTFPAWLPLLLLPYVFLSFHPELLSRIGSFAGRGTAGFSWPHFAAAFSICIALVTQLGEQADFLRFMPPEPSAADGAARRWQWRAAVIFGGIGWLPFALLKVVGGMAFAYLLLSLGGPQARVLDPAHFYEVGFSLGVDPGLARWLALALVVISQLKINATNAYAGSLAWSNFFARLTHSHPGRVVWAVFNILVAMAMMELGASASIDRALVLYANVAVAWMAAVVADLAINKPLGLSPPGIEFRRAYLYDINPVGVGALAIAAVLSSLAFLGLFGKALVPYSTAVSIGAALLASPLLAWATQGRFYLARQPRQSPADDEGGEGECQICGCRWHGRDLVDCPAYGGRVCSLCCSLDSRCDDLCKPQGAHLDWQCQRWLSWLMPGKLSGIVKPGMGSWILFMGTILLLSAFLMSFLYYHSLDSVPHGNQAAAEMLLRHVFWHMFAMWVLVFAIVGWWGVLLARSQRISHEESLGQNQVLLQEVKARQAAEERAEAENQAKSRYVSVISHELRTPLNSILGYVYLLDADPGIPEKRRRELSIIRAAGEHMTAVIGEAQDFAKIEHGKLVLEARNFDFAALLAEIVSLFSQQAEDKGLAFEFLPASHLPRRAFADDKRIRQVLINLVGNAFKFTKAGKVTLVAGFAGGKAELVVRDTGVGIPEALLPFVFKPFTQGAATASAGTGLGLPISKSLVELMGGTLTVESHEGQGSTFTVEIPLEAVDDGGGEGPEGRPGLALPCGFAGGDRRILVADDAHDDRSFLRQLLLSAGFTVAEAQNGEGVIEMLSAFHPDLVILDLSMSGMGGWATIEALNHQDLPALPQVAILSANAFERPHAPRHGIPKEAFWLKPLAIEPFLAWLARSLSIEWRYPEPTARLAISQKMAIPSEEILQELLHPIVSGYPKGVFAILDNISKMHREFLPFAQKLRALMQSFRLEEAERLVRQALQEKHGGYEEGKHAS